MKAIVTVYDGHEAAVRPRTLLWEGRRYLVAQVLTQSRSAEGKHFRVRTDDEYVFDLFYTISDDSWLIRPV
jgi:hypothetical protein